MLALHNSMHHLMEALGASSIDSNKVSGLQDKIVSLKGDIARMQSDKLVAVANVFTPDQRHAVHIAMLRHKVGEMMMGGHGKMHHRGGHEGGHPGGHDGH
jgi:Spy/CpxP family protein refolding chaperone